VGEPTFGDCIWQATSWLTAAETTPVGLPAADYAASDLCDLVTALISLSDYVLDSRGVGMDFPLTALDTWERAMLSTHQSLRLARRFLLDIYASETETRKPRPLTAVAASLQTASDLLRTHRKRPAGKPVADCSPWAQVAMSGTVSRALAAEIGRWSGLIAPWALWASHSAPPEAAGEFLAVSRCLQTAHASAAQTAGITPVTADDKELLYGIPAAYPPARIPPGDSETVRDLCAAIAVTAERLRLAAFIAPDHAAWSPSVSARGWERSARAAAIASHTAGQALRILCGQPGLLHPAETATVLATGKRLTTARDAWLRTAQTLNGITTESIHSLTRTATEAQDLMLRLGRLATGNPRWTPAKHDQRPDRRAPASLATDQATARAVLAALHQAADALAMLADRDLAVITTAETAGRLYVPTRQLPARYDIPHPYGPAPGNRAAELMTAYLSTITATRAAANHLADLALQTEAPSKVLALARRAVSADDHPLAPTAGQLAAQDRATAHPSSRSTATVGDSQRVLRSSRGQEPTSSRERSR
jgi:hypothetical protein